MSGDIFFFFFYFCDLYFKLYIILNRTILYLYFNVCLKQSIIIIIGQVPAFIFLFSFLAPGTDANSILVQANSILAFFHPYNLCLIATKKKKNFKYVLLYILLTRRNNY